jgi:hypothetical protein
MIRETKGKKDECLTYNIPSKYAVFINNNPLLYLHNQENDQVTDACGWRTNRIHTRHDIFLLEREGGEGD